MINWHETEFITNICVYKAKHILTIMTRISSPRCFAYVYTFTSHCHWELSTFDPIHSSGKHIIRLFWAQLQMFGIWIHVELLTRFSFFESTSQGTLKHDLQENMVILFCGSAIFFWHQNPLVDPSPKRGFFGRNWPNKNLAFSKVCSSILF